MNHIILFTAVLVLIIYAALLWRKLSVLQKKIIETDAQRKKQATLSLQRERLENIAITSNNSLVGTYLRFGDLNHLLLANTHTDLVASKHVVDYTFFDGLGLNPTGINVEDGFVTCLMPFHRQYNRIYECIKEVCRANDCQCHRSDDKYTPNSI